MSSSSSSSDSSPSSSSNHGAQQETVPPSAQTPFVTREQFEEFTNHMQMWFSQMLPPSSSSTTSNNAGIPFGLNTNSPSLGPSSHAGRSTMSGIANNRLVRINQPKPFDGTSINGVAVLSWCAEMENYLEAVGVDTQSTESLYIAQMCISGNALVWLQFLKKRSPGEVLNYEHLKVKMLERYYPITQKTVSMRAIFNIKYKGSIAEYNNSFMKHAQMLPEMNDTNFDAVSMQLYMQGITGTGPNVAYLLTTLNSAVQEKKARSVLELMNIALQTEETLRVSSSNRGDSSSSGTFNQLRYSNQAPSRVPFVQRFNQFSKPFTTSSAGSTPYQRTFQTPAPNRFQGNAKLNSVQADHDTDGAEEDDQVNSFEEDDSSACDDPESSEDPNLVLNVIQEFQRYNRNNISPEEFAKRRNEKLCYTCGRQGHFADRCPAAQSNVGNRKNGQ
jgi:hypothetical protein